MKPRIFTTAFSSVYPMYVQKAEKKGRKKEEVDTVICWLTGYEKHGLLTQIEKEVDFESFFAEDPLMQKIRWLDKLVDELAKGKSMEKVLRS
jgi:hypothetical protein